MKFYVRNIKKGFATNSSSYHSTVIHYIEIPLHVWVEFSENTEEVEPIDTSKNYFRSNGLNLLDDEGYIWRSMDQLENTYDYRVEHLKNNMVRIIVETTESERENLQTYNY